MSIHGAGDNPKARGGAERKEMEELLSGFDRPGRTPKTPPVAPDFVEHFLHRRASDPGAPISNDRRRRALTTVLVSARRRPAWLIGGLGLLVMTVLGMVVAKAIVTRAAPATAPEPTASSAMSTAPLVVSATPVAASSAATSASAPASGRPTSKSPRGAASGASSAKRTDFDYNL